VVAPVAHIRVHLIHHKIMVLPVVQAAVVQELRVLVFIPVAQGLRAKETLEAVVTWSKANGLLGAAVVAQAVLVQMPQLVACRVMAAMERPQVLLALL
jgi:hypothetical protein